jgi:hypothetical protein
VQRARAAGVKRSVLISRADTEAYAICVTEGRRGQQFGRSPTNPSSLPKEIAMKFPRLAIAASFAVLAVAQQVHAEARARAHAPNQNLRVEAFAGSRVPDYYKVDRVASTRRAGNEAGSALR